MRFAGLALLVALLFSGDVVRIHGHPDGVPATTDCAACVAGLAGAVEADPPPALDLPAPSVADETLPESLDAPSLLFVRQGGLRDPPTLLA